MKLAFEWYATGHYPLRRLSEFLFALGLRNRAGGRVTINGLSHLLRNPFYTGYLHLKTKDELYPGMHQPIVTKELFFAVQAQLKSRVWPRRLRHRFKYSRMFKCATCGRSLVGSERKGHVYYRCATMTCPTTSIREEAIEATVGHSVALSTGRPAGVVHGRTIHLRPTAPA